MAEMTGPPKISIVMPSLNQASFLRQAMESVLDQRYPDLELIVVDGGSSDDSPSIIRSMARHLAWWTSERDAGQAAAINKGFRRATGDIFGWLNSDDYYLDDALPRVAEAHRRHPEAGLLAGNGLRVDEHGDEISVFSKDPDPISRQTLAYGVDDLLQPSTFFLRSAWNSVGGVREDLRWCLDWDLFIRIADAFPTERVDAVLAASREHRATKTATGGFDRWEEIRAVAESHTGMPLTPGALAYFLHTLHDYLRSDPRALRYMAGLRRITERYWGTVSDICLRSSWLDALDPAAEVAPDDAVERATVAALARRNRLRRLLDSIMDGITEGGRRGLEEIAVQLDGLQRQVEQQEIALLDLQQSLRSVSDTLEHHAERLHTLERRLWVKTGRALRLI